MPNKKNILSQNAPLIFQWLPKRFGASVPNNSEYPYLQRIVNWAEKEPDRNVYLILNGAGLEKNQFRSLKEQLIPIRNIKVIDFNTVELCDDFSLQISELEHLKISELLKYDKNLITDERLKYFIGKIPFAVILDTMRLAILKNIEKITSVKEAIYMDFDILPNENQESIKIINISKNILMADGLQNEKDISGPIENSIIAINEFSEPILSEMINEIQTMFYHYARPDFQMSDGAVFGIMKEVITDHVHSELFGIPIEKLRSMRQKDFWDYQKIIKKNDEKHRVNHDALWKSYVFQKNGGNVKLTQDNSWKKRVDLYNKPILPLVFGKISANEFYIVTSLKQTLSALNSDPRIFDGTLNHSDGALIGHTLRSCLPWKSSDTTP